MKATELRIGNYVKTDVEEKHEISIEDLQFILDDDLDDYYQPIPITEEWLLRFGFKDISPRNIIEIRFIKEDFTWSSSSEEVVVELCNGFRGYDLYTDCKYVHDLQNLYFSLKRKELELK
jgi:hypothetical protein